MLRSLKIPGIQVNGRIKERVGNKQGMRFRPELALLVLIGLMIGFHMFQINCNPCYKVLRLHVVANSNSARDQMVKLKVRNAVLEYARTCFAEAKDASEAYRMAEAKKDDLREVAIQVLAQNSCPYRASVSVGHFAFPTRVYAQDVFPAGEYAAVRIVLGEGRGRNWWCVLFPPLCLEEAKNVFKDTREEKVRVKLRLVELLNQQNSFTSIGTSASRR